MFVVSYTIVASILWRCHWCDVPLCQLGHLRFIFKPRKVGVGLTSGRAGKGHRLVLHDEQRGYFSNYVFRLICPIKRKKNVCLRLKKRLFTQSPPPRGTKRITKWNQYINIRSVFLNSHSTRNVIFWIRYGSLLSWTWHEISIPSSFQLAVK